MQILNCFSRSKNQSHTSKVKKTPQARVIWILFALLFFTLVALPVQASEIINRKLNAEMQHQNGDVYDDPNYQISPDGQFVVFIANTVVEYSYLYSVPIDGSTPATRLGAVDKSVYNFEISPDSNWVVYSGQSTSGIGSELFRIPIGGGTAVSLSDSLPTGSSVWHFAISSESTQVAFDANPPNSDATELFIVPITGGTATKLFGNSDGDTVTTWQYSADGLYIVLKSHSELDDLYRIFSVAVNSGSLIQLSDTFANSSGEIPFQISPDSNYVIFLADQDTFELVELYSVPITGGTINKLTSNLLTTSVWYTISPNSEHVVYSGDQIASQHGRELWSSPIAGGTPIQLNALLNETSQILGIHKISPDSTTVVYHVYDPAYLKDDLYSVPIFGGTATKLNEIANAHRIRQFDISSNNARVVYSSDVLITIDQEEYLDNHIFSIPLGGGEIMQLTEEREWQYQYSFTLGHAGNLVFFRSHNELFCTGITGGPITDFEIEMVAGGRFLGSLQIDPTDTYVVYRADQDTLEMEELYVAFGKEITAVTLQQFSAGTQAVLEITAVVILFLAIITIGLISRSRKFS